MFSAGTGTAPTNQQIRDLSNGWNGFAPHGKALNDGARAGIKHFFPGVADTAFKGQMLLKPGFEIVKIGMSKDAFKTEIDKVLAGL